MWRSMIYLTPHEGAWNIKEVAFFKAIDRAVSVLIFQQMCIENYHIYSNVEVLFDVLI